MTALEPKPESWDPRTEPDKLRALAQITAGMLHGRPAFEQRLAELGSGYPSQGEGGSGSSDEGGPTAAAAIANVVDHREDVAKRERESWERELTRALDAAAAAWERYKRIASPRPGVQRLTDPGCELCAKVPCGCDRCSAIDGRHWCPKFATVEYVEAPKRKGAKPTVRPLVLCSSCYEFRRPDRAGRLPTHDEVLDHVEGRRRRWKVGA